MSCLYRSAGIVLALLLLAPVTACAATAAFQTTDPAGRPLDSVVLSLIPVARGALPAPRPARISQAGKAFSPIVSVVQTGTPIEFPNNDTVRHHVYSFSPAKVFELKLYAGKPEKPVLFDKPGVVVLGCNIHDHMVAYVVVVDTPWSVVSGLDGSARIADLPSGDYLLQVWHPRRLGLPDLPVRTIRVNGELSEKVVVELKP